MKHRYEFADARADAKLGCQRSNKPLSIQQRANPPHTILSYSTIDPHTGPKMNGLHARSVNKLSATIDGQPSASKNSTPRPGGLRNKRTNLLDSVEHRRFPTGGQHIRNAINRKQNIQGPAQIARLIKRTMKRNGHAVGDIDNL